MRSATFLHSAEDIESWPNVFDQMHTEAIKRKIDIHKYLNGFIKEAQLLAYTAI